MDSFRFSSGSVRFISVGTCRRNSIVIINEIASHQISVKHVSASAGVGETLAHQQKWSFGLEGSMHYNNNGV